MKQRAVIFDYDGTLIDTTPVKLASYADAFQEVFGTDPSKRRIVNETQLKLGGAPKRMQLAETLRVLGIQATEQQVERWCRLYVEANERNTPSCPEFPIVPLMLATLKTLYDLYLVSGLPDDQLKADAQRRGLASHFLEIHGGDKAAFCRAFRKRYYQQVYFLGDGMYDQQVAREAGFRFFEVQDNSDLKRAFDTLLEQAEPGAPMTDSMFC